MSRSPHEISKTNEPSWLILKDLIHGIAPPTLLRWHRERKEARDIRAFPRRYVTHRYGDLELRMLLADPTAELWYDHDWVWPPELALLRQGQLRDGAVVFNAGAHQGLIVMMLAASVGPRGRVIAAELNQHNAEVARTNCGENGVKNVDVIHGAVTDCAGIVRVDGRLNGHVVGGARGRKPSAVTALNVDALASAYGQPQVLYIDVEGHEARVLRGARRTVAARPDCFVEVQPRGERKHRRRRDATLSV
jgi:FkbM family methyltransferase